MLEVIPENLTTSSTSSANQIDISDLCTIGQEVGQS